MQTYYHVGNTKYKVYILIMLSRGELFSRWHCEFNSRPTDTVIITPGVFQNANFNTLIMKGNTGHFICSFPAYISHNTVSSVTL